jgi:putative FmdB family regulatory protein
MPNYDFKCTSCDHKFSKKVSIQEKDQVKCPVCERETKQLLTWSGAVKTSSNGGCNPGPGCGQGGFG